MKKIKKVQQNRIELKDYVLSRDSMKAIKGGSQGAHSNPLYRGCDNEMQNPA